MHLFGETLQQELVELVGSFVNLLAFQDVKVFHVCAVHAGNSAYFSMDIPNCHL